MKSFDYCYNKYRGEDRFTVEALLRASNGQQGKARNSNLISALERILEEKTPAVFALKDDPFPHIEARLGPCESESESRYDEAGNEFQVAIDYVGKCQNAKRRDIPFSLTIAEFKRIKSRRACYYTGMRLTKDDPESPSHFTLDRIDGSLGYTKENTVACSLAANTLKNMLFEGACSRATMTPKQLRKMASVLMGLSDS